MLSAVQTVVASHPSEPALACWRERLPVLAGRGMTLRDLDPVDAPVLRDLLTAPEVARFISPPPDTVAGFERFIAWAHGERRAGRYVCFAVVPSGRSAPVGIFQIRQLDPGFTTAEWGFALGRRYWGTGTFVSAARMAVDFAFDTVGVQRLEARAAVDNGRGNGALMKLGAVKEGVLRRSFARRGEYLDQALWSIVRDDWRRQGAWRPAVH